ncbi:MAG: DNA primase small subunit domain-containing protein [Candidatus Micrarchaeia archaeon]
MNEKSRILMQSLIKNYYANSNSNVAPSRVSEREFGFGDFESKIAYRHKSFGSLEALQSFLKEKAPAYVSYSSAYYRFPDARPMENKKPKGAELVFDLDASDLHLSCQKEHGTSWVCDNCLSSVKNETIRLVEDFLIPDFGFSKDEMGLNFSGNRGYHVHVYSEKVLELGSEQRHEISAYISASGLTPNSIFPTLGIRAVPLRGPTPADKGWGGKFARAFLSLLNEGAPALTAIGIEKGIAQAIVRKRAEVSLGISTGNWDKVNIPKKAEFWSNVVKSIGISQSDSIDRNVTNDPYHLIRLENTIHGGSGLVAKKLRFQDMERFNPMEDALAFGNEPIKIKITAPIPKFSMGGSEFGPFDAQPQEVEIPAYAAAYLVLKGKAEVA